MKYLRFFFLSFVLFFLFFHLPPFFSSFLFFFGSIRRQAGHSDVGQLFPWAARRGRSFTSQRPNTAGNAVFYFFDLDLVSLPVSDRHRALSFLCLSRLSLSFLFRAPRTGLRGLHLTSFEKVDLEPPLLQRGLLGDESPLKQHLFYLKKKKKITSSLESDCFDLEPNKPCIVENCVYLIFGACFIQAKRRNKKIKWGGGGDRYRKAWGAFIIVF